MYELALQILQDSPRESTLVVFNGIIKIKRLRLEKIWRK